MEITRKAAVAALTDIGIKNAAKMTTDRLQKMISRLPQTIDKRDLAVTELKPATNKLANAVANGEVLIEKNGKAPAAKKAPAKKAKKAPAKTDTQPTEEAKKAEKAKKAPAEPKEKKLSRVGSAAIFLLSLKKPSSMDYATIGANKYYEANGGKDNVKESAYAVRTALGVLEALEMVSRNEAGEIVVA